MIRSLRWRLQWWYSGLLLTVVGGFGGILYYQATRAKMQEMDVQLEGAAHYLDASLRGFPPFVFDGKDPPPPKEKEKKEFKPGPPPVRSPERLLTELMLPRELEGQLDLPEADRPYFAVWRPDGTLLKASGAPKDGIPAWDDADDVAPRPQVRERGPYREAWMRGPNNTRIVVGKSIARERRSLHAFAWRLLGIGVTVLIVGMSGGYLLAARIFRPIAAMSAAAAAMSATDMSARIDTRRVDVELAELAHVLNAMFDRLEAAFERQRRFTADASHELRTPLSILRANAELALAQTRPPDEYRQTIEACLRAANRMSSLVQGLLTLARADVGNPGMRFQPVQLDQVIAECVTSFQPLARGKDLMLTADLAPVVVNGDPESLRQLLNNLLGNAIKYTQSEGKIHVELKALSGDALLTVADTGMGIPPADRERIFERFFRVDKARMRASGGAGLGLAICKAITETHGGMIDFETRQDQGTIFRVRLPQRQRI